MCVGAARDDHELASLLMGDSDRRLFECIMDGSFYPNTGFSATKFRQYKQMYCISKVHLTVSVAMDFADSWRRKTYYVCRLALSAISSRLSLEKHITILHAVRYVCSG